MVNVPYEQTTSPQYVVYQPHNGNVVYHQQQPLIYASPVQGYPGPQVIYVQQQQVQNGPYRDHAIAALALYILSVIGFWLCALPSIILSLYMVSKKVIPANQRTAVIICGIFELIAYFFVPSFIWYVGKICFYNNGSSYCDYLWLGWIALVIWWGVTITCGIPRIIYTFNARNNNPEHC